MLVWEEEARTLSKTAPLVVEPSPIREVQHASPSVSASRAATAAAQPVHHRVVAADKRINVFFAQSNIPRLKRLLAEQICAGAGGPCAYTGRDMKTAHAGMGINDPQFNALVEDLVKSLDKYKVPAKEQQELLALLGPMRKDIVTR